MLLMSALGRLLPMTWLPQPVFGSVRFAQNLADDIQDSILFT
jgi:hypothetical protein